MCGILFVVKAILGLKRNRTIGCCALSRFQAGLECGGLTVSCRASRACRLALWLAVTASVGTGCANSPGARYVYQDGEYGVIGIPRNTFLDKTDYRAQAEQLMDRHFPGGYEIVRAEEVVEGQRTLDLGKKTEIDAEPGFAAPSQLVKLGRFGRTTSFEEKDQLALRECRIIYRRRPPDTPAHASLFAPVATLNPPLYMNPNDPASQHGSIPLLANAAAGTVPKPPAPGAPPAPAPAALPPADPHAEKVSNSAPH